MYNSLSQPMFSVVVPCYNRPELLSRALKYCKEQSYSNFEVIIVDDGSTDDLNSVVQSFSDTRFRYYVQSNAGPSAARNTGVHLARGDWIAFLDSDDTFHRKKLEVMRHTILANEADMIFSRAEISRDGSYWETPNRYFSESDNLTEYLFSYYQIIPTSTFVVKKALAIEVGFDTTLTLCEDIDFIVRAAGNGHKLVMIPDTLVTYDNDHNEARLSRVKDQSTLEMLETWLSNNRGYFTSKGYYGFRSTYLTKYSAAEDSMQTARDLMQGYQKGGVSLRLCARRGIRAFFPSVYELLVKLFLRLR